MARYRVRNAGKGSRRMSRAGFPATPRQPYNAGMPVRAPPVRRVARTSATKVAHIVRIRHRDEVEAPITDWLQEAYELADRPPRTARSKRTVSRGNARAAPSRRTRPARKTRNGR